MLHAFPPLPTHTQRSYTPNSRLHGVPWGKGGRDLKSPVEGEEEVEERESEGGGGGELKDSPSSGLPGSGRD